MMYKRYEGQFYSIGGTVWTARIMQDADTAFASIGDLSFPADTPVEIEWSHQAKEAVVCGSVATLTLVSPSDRAYIDLYTVAVGKIRLDLLKNGALYWSGCLDPEFYEEPYSTADGYNVSLTFSDFGVWKRLKYNLSGLQTLLAIINDAVSRSNIDYQSIEQSMVSTLLTANTPATADKLSVRSENFYDDDGEASTLHDVICGILQPLALRLTQRDGIIWIYDINGLYNSERSEQISWGSDDQKLGVDEVVNNVKITFSPYADSGKLSDDFEYTDSYDEDQINLTSDAKDDGEYYSYYPQYGSSADDINNVSFTIFTSDKAEGLVSINKNCRYFHILPLLGGSESEGVAQWFYTGGHGSLSSGLPERKPVTSALASGSEIMRTRKMYLPPMTEIDARQFLIRIQLEMLADPRYNFFTSKNKSNESGNYDDYADIHNAFVPVIIRLYDQDGNVSKHYENSSLAEQKQAIGRLHLLLGNWKSGDAANTDCLFQYYDPEDTDASALLGWHKNHQTIGILHGKISPSFAALDEGQYIPYPPSGGWLEVSVLSDIFRLGTGFLWASSLDDAVDLSGTLRWMLYKAPVIELVKNNIKHSTTDSNDIEYSGVLNADAKDDLEIDTICGTSETPLPTAKGLYCDSSGIVLKTLTRAARTASPEQLLIGTLYSQYAERKVSLSGTALLSGTGLRSLTDASLIGKKLMLLSDIERLRDDESEIEAVEIRPDEYTDN